MRIISGYLGGRRFNPPGSMPHTRPTTDIAKEGLFNILQNRLELEDLKTLDLFSGTGSISYELASRGVPDLTVIEKDSKMFEYIKKTSAELGIENFKVIKSDVFRFIETTTEKFDLIFAGPPYALQTIDELPKKIFEKELLNKGGWFILEHTPRNHYEKAPFYSFSRNYGTTIFTVFINQTKEE
jgi:16S rRNA (guanine(966)-N(2))-methyltransferase RsmD